MICTIGEVAHIPHTIKAGTDDLPCSFQRVKFIRRHLSPFGVTDIQDPEGLIFTHQWNRYIDYDSRATKSVDKYLPSARGIGVVMR